MFYLYRVFGQLYHTLANRKILRCTGMKQPNVTPELPTFVKSSILGPHLRTFYEDARAE
jgi:hypothetical protein